MNASHLKPLKIPRFRIKWLGNVCSHIDQKKDQAEMMDSKFTMKTADGDISIDPQLLLQRLVIAGTHAENAL